MSNNLKTVNPNDARLCEVITVLMNTRDFCGDEAQALADWESENMELTPRERQGIRAALEIEWAFWRKAAGVPKIEYAVHFGGNEIDAGFDTIAAAQDYIAEIQVDGRYDDAYVVRYYIGKNDVKSERV